MINDELFALGAVSEDWDGVALLTYDRECIICDCFRYRSRMDSETFAKALNSYAKDDKKSS